VIAKTTAGKGVSFMEGKVEWHYLPQTEEQHRVAIAEVSGLRSKAKAK
jgi:transketolase